MADPAALRRENSAGVVPLVLRLAANEVSTPDDPDPLYVAPPRLSYLPTVAEQAFEFFRHLLPPGEDTPWFDCGGVPLRWHVPIGALHDLMADAGGGPWALTLHFRGFPSDTLLRPTPGPTDPLRASIFNSLKEAACVCSGSAVGLMGMPSAAADVLWAAARAGDAAAAWAAGSGLGLDSTPRGSRPAAIPLRLSVDFGGGAVAHASRPAEVGASDAPHSLADALLAALPDPPGGEDGAWSVVAAEEGIQPALCLHGTPVPVLACGVRPPLGAPLAWVHASLAACDRFLYVSVRAGEGVWRRG